MRLGLAGGGTGGHLFPGLAVAELARDSGVAGEIVFFGAARGIEARLVPAADYDVILEPLEGVVGRGPLGALKAVARLAGATWRARTEIRRRRLDLMIGLGGYASAAGVAGARLAGVPVVLLEQNRHPGLSNRVLAHLAAAVCTSFESSAAAFPSGRARFTGNPLRSGFNDAPTYEGRDTLLVFGGSAGARSLNRAVTEALAAVAAELELPPIVHQAGPAAVEEVRSAYERAGISAEVVPFIDDMAAAYARARLAVCRAGATSVAELAATATPAVLVPFRFAAAGHQMENARELEAAGAAEVIDDDERCAERLREALARLLVAGAGLPSMSAQARVLGRPGAAQRVLGVVEEIVRAAR